MIEIISTFARWSQLTANLIVFGSCVFLAIISAQKSVFAADWVARLEKTFPWLTIIVIAGLLGILATTTSAATGISSDAWNFSAWLDIVQQTRIGHIWAARELLAVLLLIYMLIIRHSPRVRWHYIIGAAVAALPLIAGSLVSHSGAEEITFESITPYALHILLAGMWFGALPAFLLIIYTDRQQSDLATRRASATHIEQFSTIALPVMLLLALTGIVAADRMIAANYHTLVATTYGWLLNAKLAVLAGILWIAYRARYRWLPVFLQKNDNSHTPQAIAHLRKWVRIEFFMALVLELLATLLANTLPAKHAIIEHWPYPFRFSIDATWDEKNVPELVWLGLALLAVAVSTVWVGAIVDWSRKTRILVPAILAFIALAIVLPPITIQAYPETYQKPTVPFDAVSIANGSRLFAAHCVNCHGPQGKGTGVVTDPTEKDPTDLLTEPHTARHTVGNIFHWISDGIPGTQMPGFSASLTEEDRWDLVNFLHALSRGFDARLLGSMIVPEMPAVASPVFNYSAHDHSGGNLKDFRLQKNVLLVLFSWPQSKERFFQLAAAYERIQDLNTEILAVPIRALTDEELQQIDDIVPFPILTEGWSEIKDTYWLYRRVRVVPDLSGKGMFPGHMEFITDRFGYLRARWVAQFEGYGWQNIGALTLQLTQLNQEGEVMPPPGEHAH